MWLRREIFVIVLLVLTALSAGAFARQESMLITGDRLGGFVLPIQPIDGNITLNAVQADLWKLDDTQRLLLRRDVEISIGEYTFSGNAAAVWINRLPSAQGLINQIAVFFDEVENPTKRAGLGVSGPNVLITASARGEIALEAVVRKQPAESEPLIVRGERRLADYLKRLLAENQSLRQTPRVDAVPEQALPRPQPGGSFQPPTVELPERVELPPADEVPQPIFEPEGTISFFSEGTITADESRDILTATGGVIVEYAASRPRERWSQLTLTAQRGVVFLKSGAMQAIREGRLSVEAGQVDGVYLEGDVLATDGRYAVRSARVYYDVVNDSAIMLDAVLRTYLRGGETPVYARAEEMRQIAANQWSAEQAIVSTSEFATPHIALGSSRVLVTERPEEDGDVVTDVEAVNNTLRVVGVPVFWWPRFAGTIERLPLRSITVGTQENDGLGIETVWDLYSLLGVRQPDGVEADVRADIFTKRAAATGISLRYDRASMIGAIDLYGMYDTGIDKTSTGQEVDPDNTWRCYALGEHQMQLSENWLFQGQLSYISDPTFVTTWLEEEYHERREYETSAYLKYQEGNNALTLLGKYNFNDFISNDYLLASRQYSVEKLPELGYRRYGDSLFWDNFTYSSEYLVSRMRLSFQDATPEQSGVRGRAFGIADDVNIADALRQRGFSSQYVLRGDTRHELALPLDWGAFNVTPFVVGRLTAYDRDFEEFSDQGDATRLFGAAGVRINTQFQRINNNIESRLFNIHRTRHIIEPSLTLWYGHSTVSDEDLPTYDEDVESIGGASLAQLGVTNTWQTQRGGPGRWQSVDFLTLDTGVVVNSDDADRESPSPQFYEYRPEYSQFGDHLYADLIWLLSDTFTIAGTSIYDLEESVLSRGSIGASLQHSPLLRTYAEFRYLDASNNELLEIGWEYLLTPKYRVAVTPQWDFREGQFRALRMRLIRSFPDFDLIIQFRHDDIKGDTTISATLGRREF